MSKHKVLLDLDLVLPDIPDERDACGAELPAGTKFCGQCGTPLCGAGT